MEKLHEDKGPEIGVYYRLTARDTRQIYELMLDETQRAALAASLASSAPATA